MVHRTLLLCFLAGCFHWVRVDDPRALRDERVRVVDPSGASFEIEHACGAIAVEGGPGLQPAFYGRCIAVDPTRQRVYVRRFHAWKTTTIAMASVLATLTGMIGFVAAAPKGGG
jgi:hypothetical protein